jgi:hypothetical protein
LPEVRTLLNPVTEFENRGIVPGEEAGELGTAIDGKMHG